MVVSVCRRWSLILSCDDDLSRDSSLQSWMRRQQGTADMLCMPTDPPTYTFSPPGCNHIPINGSCGGFYCELNLLGSKTMAAYFCSARWGFAHDASTDSRSTCLVAKWGAPTCPYPFGSSQSCVHLECRILLFMQETLGTAALMAKAACTHPTATNVSVHAPVICIVIESVNLKCDSRNMHYTRKN